jgi:hypothetical protein
LDGEKTGKRNIMDNYFYNNIGICSFSIVSILQESNQELELTKIFLIMPFFSHKELTNYLSRGNVNILSLDSLLIDKKSYFTNFNKRFYQSLSLTINTLQYLHDIEMIQIKENKVKLLKTIEYEKTMGKRAEKINKASKNIVKILQESNQKLYLNLRVEL